MVLPYIWTETASNAVVALTTVALYLAYGCPVFLRYRHRTDWSAAQLCGFIGVLGFWGFFGVFGGFLKVF